jgi:hypothetical protein
VSEQEPPARATRRIQLTLRKPRVGLYPKPTVVIDGRGQPAQWGTGTWVVAADEPTVVGVFLFARGLRFGEAEATTSPGDEGRLTYSAPVLPLGPGRFDADDR